MHPFDGLANTGGALQIRVHLRLTAFFQDHHYLYSVGQIVRTWTPARYSRPGRSGIHEHTFHYLESTRMDAERWTVP